MEANNQQQWNGNVWIHDNWTDEEKAQALNSLSEQNTLTPDQLEKQQRAFNQFRRNAGTNWNVFYEQNQNKFFKDRHYLHKAFPLEFAWLYPDDDAVETGVQNDAYDGDVAGDVANTSCTSQHSLDHWSKYDEVHVIEIGCGVGNAILPLLEQHTKLTQQSSEKLPQLHIHCLDFAPNAIQILKQDGRFRAASDEDRATAHVYDLSAMSPATISIKEEQSLANSADIAILLFCLSAIGPHPSDALARAARHVIDMLKPGGILIIRDYGRLDEAQLKLGKGNKELGDNFYQKGDGTGVYYFELNDLKELFGNGEGSDSGGYNDKLDVLELNYIQRVYRNRGDGTTRRRIWVQGRFQKPMTRTVETDITSSRDSISMIQKFLSTSIHRWDSYYKTRCGPYKVLSLEEALAAKHPNNLLQIYPDEFGQWKMLLDPPKMTKRKVPATDNHDTKTERLPSGSRSNATVIDVGCGLGNGTLLNILAKQRMQDEKSESVQGPRLKVHFIDASTQAIERLTCDPRYKYAERTVSPCIASNVVDVTASISTADLQDLTADIALLIFSLSSLGPVQENPMESNTTRLGRALKNVRKMLKPGGMVLFRDFGRYDDDQLQLNSCFESRICDNFYFRDDATSNGEVMGTAVYFFDLEEIRQLFTCAGFEVVQLEYLIRPYSKSGKQSKNLHFNGGAAKRTRIWVHGRFCRV